MDATEEEVVVVDDSLVEEKVNGKPPTDDGVGTDASTFSPIVKGKPPGLLADSSCLEAATSFSLRLLTSL